MYNFRGIMICTDLDGTLFRNDRTISKENLDAIARFRSGGGIFTFITGRMPYFSAHVCEAVGSGDTPFGCVNGAAVFDPRAGKYLWRQEISADALSLAEYVAERLPDVGVQVNTFERVCFCRENAAMEDFRRITGLPNCACGLSEINEPIAKIVFGDRREERIGQVAALLAEHPRSSEFSYIRSEKILYEILPKGISKATAMLKLASFLNIVPERTVALGDYNNDIEMLRAAGVGIAVENARPEVKEAADFVTVSNEAHAIAKTVEDIERGRIFPLG